MFAVLTVVLVAVGVIVAVAAVVDAAVLDAVDVIVVVDAVEGDVAECFDVAGVLVAMVLTVAKRSALPVVLRHVIVPFGRLLSSADLARWISDGSCPCFQQWLLASTGA